MKRKQYEPKHQQFLQQVNNDKFEMVLIEQSKQATACTKSQHDKNSMQGSHVNLPSVGFSPIAASTPKRKNTSFEAVGDLSTKPGPRLTMSQFLGEIPYTSRKRDKFIKESHQHCRKPTKEVAVRLRNFVSQPPNAFETIIMDNFTDNNSCVTVSPSRNNEFLQQKAAVETPTPNLNSTKDVLRSIFSGKYPQNSGQTTAFRNTIESILNATDSTERSIDALYDLEKQSKSQKKTLITGNDSIHFAVNNIFENDFERESLSFLEVFSSHFQKFKVPKVPNTQPPPRKTNSHKVSNIQKPIINSAINAFLNSSVLLHAPKRGQRTKDPILKSHEFEKDLQRLTQVHQQRMKGNNYGYNKTSGDLVQINDTTFEETMGGNKELHPTEQVEFWKRDEDLIRLGDLLERMEP